MRLRWSQSALEDLESIHSYVAQDSPGNANALIAVLMGSALRLQDFPRSGRVVPELRLPSLREVIAQSYRIVYRVEEHLVEVVAVIHTAQMFPGDVLDE